MSEVSSTVRSAAVLVSRYADTQTCLERDFRDALKVVARAAINQAESDQIKALKNLIHHAWIHSAYSDLGRSKMTRDEQVFYGSLKAEFNLDAEDLDL